MEPSVECYFQNIREIIVKFIRNNDRVDICTAWFSSERILQELEDKEGTVIVGVPEGYNSSGGAFLCSWNSKIQEYLPSSRFRVCFNRKEGIIHHKFLIFYIENVPTCVITGSYNLTEAAETNRENIVVIRELEIINKYIEEFEYLRSISKQIYN